MVKKSSKRKARGNKEPLRNSQRTTTSTCSLLKNKVVILAEKNGFDTPCYKTMLDYTINNLQSNGLGEAYYGYHNIDHLLEIPLGVLLVGNSKQIINISDEDLKYLFVSAIFHDFEPDKIIDKPSDL